MDSEEIRRRLLAVALERELAELSAKPYVPNPVRVVVRAQARMTSRRVHAVFCHSCETEIMGVLKEHRYLHMRLGPGIPAWDLDTIEIDLNPVPKGHDRDRPDHL